VATLPPLYAHRLGREPGPDSSRAALRATLAGPVHGLETDVCLTGDGRLVLLHDPWLSTGTTSRGWAHEAESSELCHARLRDRDGAATNETPMLLDELLDVAPGDLAVQVEARWGALAGVGGVCIEHFLLHEGLVDRLRLDGLSVTTGTVNDATLAARAAALGVDAITTDRPAALCGELAAMLLAA
jgi:glycerophosphoryl diester phosphodiesterase